MVEKSKIINRSIGFGYIVSGICVALFLFTVIQIFDVAAEFFATLAMFYVVLGIIGGFILFMLFLGTKHIRAPNLSKFKTPMAGIFVICCMIITVGGYVYSYTNIINVQPSAKDHFPYNVGPYLTWNEDPSTSICITWLTPEKTATELQIGDTSLPGDSWKTYSDAARTTLHRITITGLDPGKDYYYQIKNFDHDSNIHRFQTAPVEGSSSPFRFAIYGDSQNGGGDFEAVFKDIVTATLSNAETNGNFNFFIHAGDFVDQGNDLKSWRWTLDELTRMGSSAPFQLAAGNHDLGDTHLNDPDAVNYPDQGANYKYFLDYNYEPYSAPISAAEARYYSFTYGNAHFVAIDTEANGNIKADSAQMKWVEADLKAASENLDIQWIVCYYHRPVFSQYEGAGSQFSYFDEKYNHYEYFTPMFDRYGVDIVFQGHVHDYQAYNWTLDERVPYFNADKHTWDHHDTMYFVTGGAANDYNCNAEYPTNSPYMLGGQHTDHYMTVDIEGNRCEINAWYVNNTLLQGNQSYVIVK